MLFRELQIEQKDAARLLTILTNIAEEAHKYGNAIQEEKQKTQAISTDIEKLRRDRMRLEFENPGNVNPETLSLLRWGTKELDKIRNNFEGFRSVYEYLLTDKLAESDGYRSRVSEAVSTCATFGGYLFELLNDERTRRHALEMRPSFMKLVELTGYIVECFGICQRWDKETTRAKLLSVSRVLAAVRSV